jgi:DNA-binding CsgD family transcriptional regulator
MTILATGAATDTDQLSTQRVHPDASNDIGWTLSDASHPGPAGTHPRIAKLRDLPSWSRWPVTPAGKRWSKLGVREMLVADIAIPHCSDHREINLEIGSPSAMQRFDRCEAEIVSAVMPVLAGRASLAFGDSYTQTLTTREQLILVQLVSGASVREIAERIDRSPHTVHDHVKSLHRKLDASSRGELVSRYLGFEEDAPKPTSPSAEAKDMDDHSPQIATRKARPASTSPTRS